MTTTHQHARIRHYDQIESAQTQLDQAIQLQDEIRGKLERVRQLTGIRINQYQDLEEVGTVEEMVEGEG